jgi:hypothetical protein
MGRISLFRNESGSEMLSGHLPAARPQAIAVTPITFDRVRVSGRSRRPYDVESLLNTERADGAIDPVAPTCRR